MDLARQLYLGLTQVVKGLLLDLYQLDNLIHEHNRTDPVPAEDLIYEEERAFVVAEPLRDFTLTSSLTLGQVCQEAHTQFEGSSQGCLSFLNNLIVLLPDGLVFRQVVH